MSVSRELTQTFFANPDIFISYSHSDKKVVYRELELIEKWGYRVWIDSKMFPGMNWTKRTGNALEKSKLFLLFITSNSIKSNRVLDELTFAKERKKSIVVIYIHNVSLPSEFHFQLVNIQALYKYACTKYQYQERLHNSLRKHVGYGGSEIHVGDVHYWEVLLSNIKNKLFLLSKKLYDYTILYKYVLTCILLTAFVCYFMFTSSVVVYPGYMRHTGTELSRDVANKTIKKNNYYDSRINSAALGWNNQFRLVGKYVVYDKSTQLYWQVSGSRDMNYNSIHKYINSLNREEYAGYSNWRLPTFDEAMSLLEPAESAHIDPIFDTSIDKIWTSDYTSTGNKWIVDFRAGNGKDVGLIRIKKHHVKAVSR